MTFNNLIPWGRKNLPIKKNGMEGDTRNSSTLARSPDFERTFGDIEHIFENFLNFPDFTLEAPGVASGRYFPSVDVHETEKEFQISVEVPGMDEKDIDIAMSSNVLTITGEKKEEIKKEVRGTHRIERRYGSFSRSIPLPENCVDIDQAAATYKNGVLMIRLPKNSDYKKNVKKIPVRASFGGNSEERN